LNLDERTRVDELLSCSNVVTPRRCAVCGDLLIVGVAGKMGPSLAVRARRAALEAGVPIRIIGVARFTRREVRRQLDEAGIETISADVLNEAELAALPEAPNVIHMAARKFGSTGDEAYTWAMNSYLPARVAERYRGSRIVAFSSGNVYPLVPVVGGGATEDTPLEPTGEYAMSALARERLLSYFSACNGTPMAILRSITPLSCAMECSRYRYEGFERRPVDLEATLTLSGRGDANPSASRMRILPGPPVRQSPDRNTRSGASLGLRFSGGPVFLSVESDTALLNNAARCFRLFAIPPSADQIID
jgi:hypothetical protein